MITPDQLVVGARSCLGVPWLHQGRTSAGVDCIGFITLAGERAGMSFLEILGIEDRRDYGRSADPTLLERTELYCRRAEGPVVGGIALIQFKSERNPRHFVLFTSPTTIIHANGGVGRVVEHGYRSLWVKWTHSFWLLPGVDYGIS